MSAPIIGFDYEGKEIENQTERIVSADIDKDS